MGGGGQSARQLAGGIAAVALVAALAGCAGEGTGLLQGGATGAAAVAGDPLKPAAAQKAFNPFDQTGVDETPGRDVIANPTLAQVLEPGPLPEYALGRAEAPVVMVKYMSLTCPYCRRFMAETFPALKRDYIDTGKVRLVIREFPIGKASGNATIALRCAPMTKYLDLYNRFLQQQAQWVAQEVRTDQIFKVAAQAGVTREAFDACMKDEKLIAGLRQVKERGRQLGIIGTPNFFIGTRLVKTVVGIDEMRRLLDAALAGGGSPPGKAG